MRAARSMQHSLSVVHNHFAVLQVAILGALANYSAAKADVLLALELLEHEEVPR